MLKEFSFESPDILSLAILGPSGGGKTSLLRVLAGLDAPTGGRVSFDDEYLDFTPASLKKHHRETGVVFQASNLFPHLSALENILLPLEKVHSLKRSEAVERAQSYLERFRLVEHAHKRPSQLSGGQKQRIAIVRALATQPKRVLLDEPTSALDPEMTGEVLKLIEDLREQRVPTVMVTHHVPFARKMADHILFVADGRLVDSGTAQNVLEASTHPEVKKFFARIFI